MQGQGIWSRATGASHRPAVKPGECIHEKCSVRHCFAALAAQKWLGAFAPAPRTALPNVAGRATSPRIVPASPSFSPLVQPIYGLGLEI